MNFFSITKLKTAEYTYIKYKLMTEQTYTGNEIPIYSVKDSRKFKDIQAALPFNLCDTSVTS